MTNHRSSTTTSVRRQTTVSSVIFTEEREHSVGNGCTSSSMAEHAAVRISPAQSHSSGPAQSKEAAAIINSDSPELAQQAMDGRTCVAPPQPALAASVAQRRSVTGTWSDLSPSPRETVSLGLACDRLNLEELGLPLRWLILFRAQEHHLHIHCTTLSGACLRAGVRRDIVLDSGKAFSTIKVYLGMVSAFHVGFGNGPVGQHALIRRFMKRARQILPAGKPLVPSWDLTIALEAYESHGSQPLKSLWYHSTRGIATSWDLFRGISVSDICATASWAYPHILIRYCHLDVTVPSLA